MLRESPALSVESATAAEVASRLSPHELDFVMKGDVELVREISHHIGEIPADFEGISDVLYFGFKEVLERFAPAVNRASIVKDFENEGEGDREVEIAGAFDGCDRRAAARAAFAHAKDRP